jgi:hypothetical protein
VGRARHGQRIRRLDEPSGEPIAVSAAVLTPRPEIAQSHKENATRTVAWAHGTTGVADQCEPRRYGSACVYTSALGRGRDMAASFVARLGRFVRDLICRYHARPT